MQAGKWISLKTVGWSSSLVTWAVRFFFFNCIGVGIWTSAGDVILFTTSGIWWQKEYCCNSFWLKYTSIDPKFRQVLCGTHAKWVKAVYGRLNSQSCFLYLLTAVTETHKQTDQLLLECCGTGSSFVVDCLTVLCRQICVWYYLNQLYIAVNSKKIKRKGEWAKLSVYSYM